MGLVDQLTAVRYRLEDGISAAGRAVMKALNPQISMALEQQRMFEPARRGSKQLLMAYRVSPWLQAATKKIAERFTATEWQLYAQVNVVDGKATRLHDPRSITRSVQRAPLERRDQMLYELKQVGELQQIHTHPLLDMLGSGNTAMTGYAARLLTQLYRDMVGECFWALSLNVAGRPDQFWPMPPTWVSGLPTEKDPNFKLEIEGSTFKLPKDQIIWFREPDPTEPYGRGTGLAMALGDELETDEYAARFVKAFFLNRAKPELLIGVEGMDSDGLRAAKIEFERQHRGHLRAHRSWWYNTKIDVKELTQKFTDMELSSLRTWERDIVLNVFGIPPEQMGIVTSSNRATAYESENIMARSVLVPRLESFREQMQDELVPRYDPRLILHYVSPVPEDKDLKLEAMKAAPHMVTRGEWRQTQGFQDRGEGDDIHLQPLNLREVRAPEPETVTVSRAKAIKVFVEAMIPQVLDQLTPDRIQHEIEPVWLEGIEEWGAAALEGVGSDVAFNMLNPLVVGHMESVTGERIVMINDTTRAAVRDALIEGVRAGEGIGPLSERVRGVFSEADQVRAERIARTEVTRSSSFASENAWQQSGIVWGKEWLVVPDGDRHDSQGYGGVVAKVGEVFVFPDGRTAMHPGEFAEVGQNANCRCAISPVVNEPGSEERQLIPPGAPATESQRLTWERIAISAYRRAFRNQERDVLAELRRLST